MAHDGQTTGCQRFAVLLVGIQALAQNEASKELVGWSISCALAVAFYAWTITKSYQSVQSFSFVGSNGRHRPQQTIFTNHEGFGSFNKLYGKLVLRLENKNYKALLNL